jgi:CubicO group peptidase (beta-lactamase class C family)
VKPNFDKLISYVEEIKERNHSSAASIVVIKNNKIVLEHYSGFLSNLEGSLPVSETSMFNIASARKSYLGLAIALALYEGKIKSLDDQVTEYFESINQGILAGTTIRHLVTHSHGLNDRKDGSIFREFAPGSRWAYRGVNITMMTELIHKLYDKSFPEIIQEKVFLPMGFTHTTWATEPTEKLVKVVDDPQKPGLYKLGSSKGGYDSNLHTSALEFALWGELHLNNGVMNGKQIVPKEVIQLATKVHSPDFGEKEFPQNGLFWYVQDSLKLKSEIGERVPKGSYQILGVTGPTLLVIPEYQLVIAKMYNKRYNYGGNNYLHYLREFSNLVADIFKA